MNSFRSGLAERCADVRDWIDYRPDANFWPCFAIPPMLSVAWAYGGWIGVGILFAFAFGTMLAVGALTAVGLAAWIVAQALLDLVPAPRSAAPLRTTRDASMSPARSA